MAIKFYLPEDGHDQAVKLLDAAEASAVELSAPGTIFPEGFNALAQQQRRGLLDAEDGGEAWEKLLAAPVYTYKVEDLIGRAAQISQQTTVIVYDALFLALAEEAETVVVTADDKLLKALRGTDYAKLARSLTTAGDLLA